MEFQFTGHESFVCDPEDIVFDQDLSVIQRVALAMDFLTKEDARRLISPEKVREVFMNTGSYEYYVKEPRPENTKTIFELDLDQSDDSTLSWNLFSKLNTGEITYQDLRKQGTQGLSSIRAEWGRYLFSDEGYPVQVVENTQSSLDRKFLFYVERKDLPKRPIVGQDSDRDLIKYFSSLSYYRDDEYVDEISSPPLEFPEHYYAQMVDSWRICAKIALLSPEFFRAEEEQEENEQGQEYGLGM